MKRQIHIVQVNTSDEGGGAEKFAFEMHRNLRAKGYTAVLVVDKKRTENKDVVQIPKNAFSIWYRLCFSAADFYLMLRGKRQGAGRIQKWLKEIGQPKKTWEIRQGHENFEFPESWRILDLFTYKPDIIHCHNLHGGYFDLRALPWLSHQIPVIITMHDAWLLSGNCAHSFDCGRWETGCGQCPDLTIFPGIKRDATAFNWQLKKEIYSRSLLFVATPCDWLMQKVKQSILFPAILESKVIPNGINLAVFHPADMRSAREKLCIAQNATVILFVANRIKRNIWKDSQTMMEAIRMVAERCINQKILFIAVGEHAPPELIGKAEILFVPYQKDPSLIAAYYQAADIYLHAAKADTFPTTILEALACGTPVVATSVGGIPEQVRSLFSSTIENIENGVSQTMDNCILSGLLNYPVDKATGILVPPGNPGEMARAIELLIMDEPLRKQLGVNAVKDACERFDFERCANDYLTWYKKIIGN